MWGFSSFPPLLFETDIRYSPWWWFWFYQLTLSCRGDWACGQAEGPGGFSSGAHVFRLSWELRGARGSALPVTAVFLGRRLLSSAPTGIRVSVSGVTPHIPELSSPIPPHIVHHPLLPGLTGAIPRTTSISLASSLPCLFLALFLLFRIYGPLLIFFLIFISIMYLLFNKCFLGSFLGTWPGSRGRHMHTFWDLGSILLCIPFFVDSYWLYHHGMFVF